MSLNFETSQSNFTDLFMPVITDHEMLRHQSNSLDRENYILHTRKFADFSVILSLVQNAENCEKVEGIFFYLYLFASQDKKVEFLTFPACF